MAETMSDSEKKKEDWMNSKWRPACGWMYIFICLFDFMIAPILWSITQAVFHGGVNVQWQPLTLQGAGLFHVAMGAIIGVSAYGRTQEKLGGANNGGISLPSNAGTTYVPPGQGSVNVSNQPNGLGGGFGEPSFGYAATRSFGSPTPSFAPAPAVTTGFGGKKAPPEPDYPEI